MLHPNISRLLACIAQEQDREALHRRWLAEDVILPGFLECLVLGRNSTAFEVLSVRQVEAAVLEVLLLDNDGMPYRLLMGDPPNWRGLSLQFECLGCFGDDPGCGVCGGSGWGVL